MNKNKEEIISGSAISRLVLAHKYKRKEIFNYEECSFILNKLIENDKEIERLTKECIGMKDEIKDLCNKLSESNNIIDELEKWLKDEANFWKKQQEEAIKNGWLEFGGKYNTTLIYENAINKLKELKGELNE